MKVAELFEEIKGWKHAGRDIAAARAARGKEVKLVRLKKDGAESGMNDATKLFRSEEEARRHHASMVQLNPGKSIKHNLYIDGKKELLEGKTPTKSYGKGSKEYWVEVYDEKKDWGDVVAIRADSQEGVYDFCSDRGWEIQGLELNEGLFSKKPKEKKLNRTDITADDRKMITAVFKTGHNANEKFADDRYVLPQNITVNHRKARINVYKDGDVLKASVGHYDDESGPGNPRKSPMFHTDHDLKTIDDVRKLHKTLSEGVAPPFQRFKKGQIVTVKKTGQKVEVLKQDDVGLVWTVSVDPADRKIKNWRDYAASTSKGLISGAGHQEYMPRELEA